MVQQSALLTKLPPWQRQSRDPCVLAKTLQLQFTAAGCSDLRRVASWRCLAYCTGRVSRERDTARQRGPRRGCRMVAWLEPALGHIEIEEHSWSRAQGGSAVADGSVESTVLS